MAKRAAASGWVKLFNRNLAALARTTRSAQRCWNGYDTRSGRAHAEVALILAAMRGHHLPAPWSPSPGQALLPLPPLLVIQGQRRARQVTDFKHRGHTAVTLIDVAQLGHAWSGGAPNQPYSDAQGPDASRMVWTFVSKQFPPTRAALAPNAPQPAGPAARVPAQPAFTIPSLLNPLALLASKGATLKP
ncbi:MAG: hypothetical protein QUV35_16495 [Hydrogenophaga sp.]|uniref:hypothetical protein n=1 Tax=Hydrogenophaga sp. TaxID=1904254 RepID=UPI002626357F|nr:hypothetical protein [Hydrogenophaga sp.]MDM7944224.1 hypothetical protein [Hydrogenophaga sp.]